MFNNNDILIERASIDKVIAEKESFMVGNPVKYTDTAGFVYTFKLNNDLTEKE